MTLGVTTYHDSRDTRTVETSTQRAEQPLLVGAVCAELQLEDGDAPEWMHLLPLGPEVVGRDGRRWKLSDPEAFVLASQSELPAPVDYMHASEIQKAGDAPAAGWITELRVVREGEGRAPGIWGRIDWTPRGRRAVAEREYRFQSPAFLHRKDGEIVRLTSAGLVHKPNLTLTALNARGDEEEIVMTEEQRRAMCQKLGLAGDASVDAILARIDALNAAQQALNMRGEVVPKADLEQALNRAQTAEQKLREYEKQAFCARVDAVLDQAQREGKFPPASRDFYRALCTSDEALARLEAEMKSRPSLVAPMQAQPAPEAEVAVNSVESDAWIRV